MQQPKPGSIYFHYKDKAKLYRVIGIGKHTETKEDLVFYEALYKKNFSQLFARPLAMWLEEVDYEGVKQPRFTQAKEK